VRLEEKNIVGRIATAFFSTPLWLSCCNLLGSYYLSCRRAVLNIRLVQETCPYPRSAFAVSGEAAASESVICSRYAFLLLATPCTANQRAFSIPGVGETKCRSKHVPKTWVSGCCFVIWWLKTQNDPRRAFQVCTTLTVTQFQGKVEATGNEGPVLPIFKTFFSDTVDMSSCCFEISCGDDAYEIIGHASRGRQTVIPCRYINFNASVTQHGVCRHL